MATYGGSRRLAIRRQRAWSIALTLSAALHLIVLGWFALKRAVTEWRADPPAVDVQLVRLSPRTPTETRSASTPSAGRAPRVTAAAGVVPRLTTGEAAGPSAPGAPGPAIDPRWLIDRSAPTPKARRELDVAEFMPCDPLRDPKRESKACQKVDEIERSLARANDPKNGKGEYAREARHNEAVRRYNEAPGNAGYSGIRCHVFHRC